MEQEIKNGVYAIPDGFTAKIKDGKIIIEKEDENIRKEIIEFLTYGIWRESDIDKVKQSQKYAKWITYLEKQKEQKPVEITPNQFDGIIYGMNGYVSEKPAGWNEEEIETIFDDYAERRDTYASCIRRLKPLRPQPHWRPSEEQMDALHYVKQFDYGGHRSALESLYYDLKKL